MSEEEEVPVEGEGGQGEGGEGEKAAEPPITLKVRIESCRNVPDDAKTTVSYAYSLKRPVLNDEGEAEEDEEALKGTYEAPEEMDPEDEGYAPVVPNKYDLETAHELPAVSEEMLYRLITAPLEIKVEGLLAPGKVVIPLSDLVYKKDPNPKDPDDPDFLPGAPGAIVRGWYKVQLDGDLPEQEEAPAEPAEGEEPPPPPPTFPEDAEVFVWLELSKLLVPLDELPLLNIVTFTVSAMHNIPERWRLKEEEDNESHLYKYELTYTMPGAGQGEGGADDISITVEPGVVVGAYVAPVVEEGEGEEGADKAEGGGEGGGEEGGEGEGEKKEGEKKEGSEGGEGGSKVKEEVVDVFEKIQRTSVKASRQDETKGHRLEFNHVHSVVLRGDQVTKLKQVIDNKGFCIDVTRKLRSDEDYVYSRKYRGTCAPDIAELMKHDQTKASVRCLVTAHDDYAQPTEEELEAVPPPEGEPEDDTEASPYVQARTYVRMSVKTMRPLVPKPKPSKKPLPKVGDLITTRPPKSLQSKGKGSDEALAEEIRGVVEGLADEYAALFMGPAADPSMLTPDGADERRQKAIFRLNQTGKYYQFKDRLAGAVARVVKEHMMGGRDRVDLSSVEGKRFLSDCYSRLQMKVNSALNGIFNPPTQAKKVSDGLGDDELEKLLLEERRLAEEAELILNYTLAATHLNQRILLSPTDNILWYDHGVMCLRSANFQKGEDCFREALALDPRHVPSLLAYAVLLCLQENYTNAETFLKGAVDFEPSNHLAWAMCVLYYDIESRDMDRRAALKRYIDVTESEVVEEGGGSQSAYMCAGEFCATLNATPLCVRAAEQEVAKRGATQKTRILTARARLASSEHTQCREVLAEALQIDRRLAVAMILKAHSTFLENGWATWRSNLVKPASADAIACYVKASEVRVPYTDALSRLRLGKLDLAEANWYAAKAVFLDACRENPSATTWLGLGISCMGSGDYGEAEEALSEGNIMDPKNAQIWGYLCVVCMKRCKGRPDKLREAEESLKHALTLGIGIQETFPVDKFIIEQIGDEFKAVGLYDLAIQAYEKGLEEKDSAPSLCLNLAQAFVAINDLPKAVECYDKIGECSRASVQEKVNALREAMELCNALQEVGSAKMYKIKLQTVLDSN